MLFQKVMPICKVDEGRRTIEGIICSEALDKDGERMSYADSKPNFIIWSDQISKATAGKNLGNLREMHALRAVGAGRTINFDDVNRTIKMSFAVVDDQCWAKCMTGCLNSFSIGGSYQKRWKGGDGAVWYQALPAEVSVVDSPSNADCSFELIRASGAHELRKFHKIGSHANANEYQDQVLALLDELIKAQISQARLSGIVTF